MAKCMFQMLSQNFKLSACTQCMPGFARPASKSNVQQTSTTSMHLLIRSRLLPLHSHIYPVPKHRAHTGINSTLARSPAVSPHRTTLPHWFRHLFSRLGSISSKARVMASANTAQHTHLNRLAQEESPYLLQHQHNPVSCYMFS